MEQGTVADELRKNTDHRWSTTTRNDYINAYCCGGRVDWDVTHNERECCLLQAFNAVKRKRGHCRSTPNGSFMFCQKLRASHTSQER